MGDGLGGGVCDGELGGVDGVAELEPARGARSGVGCDAVGGLAGSKVHCYSDDLLAFDGEVDGVRNSEGAIGDTDTRFTGEGDLLDCLGLDLMNTGRVVGRKSDRDGCDREKRATKYIREL